MATTSDRKLESCARYSKKINTPPGRQGIRKTAKKGGTGMFTADRFRPKVQGHGRMAHMDTWENNEKTPDDFLEHYLLSTTVPGRADAL